MQFVCGPLSLAVSSPELDEIRAKVDQLLQVYAPMVYGFKAQLDALQASVNQLTEKETHIMAVIDDLDAAVAALTAEEASEVQRYDAIIALLQTNPSAAGVQAVVTKLQGITADLKSRAQASPTV